MFDVPKSRRRDDGRLWPEEIEEQSKRIEGMWERKPGQRKELESSKRGHKSGKG